MIMLLKGASVRLRTPNIVLVPAASAKVRVRDRQCESECVRKRDRELYCWCMDENVHCAGAVEVSGRVEGKEGMITLSSGPVSSRTLIGRHCCYPTDVLIDALRSQILLRILLLSITDTLICCIVILVALVK